MLFVVTGEPFRIKYWLAQCGVYLAVMLVEKLVTGPVAALSFWSKVCVCVLNFVCLSCCVYSPLFSD